jgi:glycosyltransferase involved in cell wall biosynthesis
MCSAASRWPQFNEADENLSVPAAKPAKTITSPNCAHSRLDLEGFYARRSSAGTDGQCVIVPRPALANCQPELAAIYRDLSRTKPGILCLIADFEPMGLMPLEAMTAGLPVVVTNVVGD